MGIGYWPDGAARTVEIGAFVEAYRGFGYTLCFDGVLENGVEKVALYGKDEAGTEIPTHAALQLETGKWTSKIGPFEDIEHETAADVEGPVYGRVVCYLARPRPG
jgi:hypothetical protein